MGMAAVRPQAAIKMARGDVLNDRTDARGDSIRLAYLLSVLTVAEGFFYSASFTRMPGFTSFAKAMIFSASARVKYSRLALLSIPK